MEFKSLRFEIANTQVVVLAGGRAKRMGIDFPKCLLEVSGKKLIDICIESLTKEDFRKFVFLLGHRHELVMQHLGDGSKYNIEAKYSVESQSSIGWGKAKAFKHALRSGIDLSRRSIVVFPDDIILERDFYSRFLMNHLEAVQKHRVLASAVLVPDAEYPYGVAKVDSSGMILGFTEKPLIKRPTSVGIYAFEPQVYGIVEETIDLDEQGAVELESTIFPLLARKHKLFSFFISRNKWLPINTVKEYERAIKVLTVSKL
ncbi:MAG: NDP-sugar synthase [Nitrososphaerales archaeon]